MPSNRVEVNIDRSLTSDDCVTEFTLDQFLHCHSKQDILNVISEKIEEYLAENCQATHIEYGSSIEETVDRIYNLLNQIDPED